MEAKAIRFPNIKDEAARITNKASIYKVVEEIRKKLNPVNNDGKKSSRKERQLKKMQQSCFKDLFSMRQINFSGGLVHHLVKRQSVSTDTSIMEFNFNGKGAQFTRNEFGLITGLNMGPIPTEKPLHTSDRIRSEYFNNEDKITNAMVKDAFTYTKHFMEEDDMVKLSLIYLLECGILGKESQTHIDNDHLAIVEDLEYFNSYPWGTLSYNSTMTSLAKALLKKDGVMNPSGTYSLGGFTLAFQVYH